MNYVDIVSQFFQGVGVTALKSDCQYEDLVWDSTVISKVDLESKVIQTIRDARIALLTTQASEKITKEGFISFALNGNARLYDSEISDQINLIGASSAIQSGESIPFPSRDPITKVKTFDLHTSDQLNQVLNDGSRIKTQILENLLTLKKQINTLTSQEEINSINLIA